MTTMIAKFSGRCAECGRSIAAGDPILWAKGLGARHATADQCARAEAPPAPAARPTLDLRPIHAFLSAAAARGLKKPAARFLAPGGGELRLRLAGPQSKNPGALFVDRDAQYLGSIAADGVVRGALASDLTVQAAFVTIAADPADAASQYGALTCRCSFCSLPLSDAGSVDVGYGPICARKWGLPHQPKGTPVLTGAAS